MCLNGGFFNDTQCICPNGFEGNRCERAETCNSKSCLDPMTCVAGKCVCPDNVNCSLSCADEYPCFNGGTCHIRGAQYYCKCPNGFNGKLIFQLIQNLKNIEFFYKSHLCKRNVKNNQCIPVN